MNLFLFRLARWFGYAKAKCVISHKHDGTNCKSTRWIRVVPVGQWPFYIEGEREFSQRMQTMPENLSAAGQDEYLRTGKSLNRNSIAKD